MWSENKFFFFCQKKKRLKWNYYEPNSTAYTKPPKNYILSLDKYSLAVIQGGLEDVLYTVKRQDAN